MAKLTDEGRNKLPDSDFALEGRRYPIPDKGHARDALARVAANGTASEKRRVRAAVELRFPRIAQEKSRESGEQGGARA